MPSVNADLADRTLTHEMQLSRVQSAQVRAVLVQLLRLERDLIRDLERAHLTTWRRDRYERLLRQTRETIRSHYKVIRDTQAEMHTQLVDLESQWVTRSINSAIAQPIGVYIPLASVAWTPQQLQSLATNAIIDGAKSAQWWARQAADTQSRFAAEVKSGLLRGAPTDEIVRAVRGTAATGYTDGIMALSRTQATALVRTSISAVAHDARIATYKENSDLINSQTWLSTLDSRTTIEYCIPRSMKKYTLDGKPIGHDLPWGGGPGKIHWQCRSTATANLKAWGELAGKTIPGTDGETVDRFFRQRLRERGFDEERIAAARRRTQSSMDGQVSADIDYQTWLRSKSAAFQDEVLGKGKAELFRSGLLTNVSQLVNQDGNPLTLKQLRRQLGVLTES